VPPPKIVLRVDDLSEQATRTLIAQHLGGMHEHSPPESVHALGIEALKDPAVTLWSAWVDGEIAGCGALKRLDDDAHGARRGEIKSMRVANGFLGKGIGRAILDHIIAEARRSGITSVWLETGSGGAFLPAIRLYESSGFARCGPFGSYAADPFSVFMTRRL
jgi:putative acetyltransferase